jgi:hypothetical protein
MHNEGAGTKRVRSFGLTLTAYRSEPLLAKGPEALNEVVPLTVSRWPHPRHRLRLRLMGLNLPAAREGVPPSVGVMIGWTVLINGERLEVFDFRETFLADPLRQPGRQVLSIVTFTRPWPLAVGSSVQDEAGRNERFGIVDACNHRQDAGAASPATCSRLPS